MRSGLENKGEKMERGGLLAINPLEVKWRYTPNAPVESSWIVLDPRFCSRRYCVFLCRGIHMLPDDAGPKFILSLGKHVAGYKEVKSVYWFVFTMEILVTLLCLHTNINSLEKGIVQHWNKSWDWESNVTG